MSGGKQERLLRELRRALRAAAEPEKAPAMQAYMKSTMPYLGVQTPALRRVCRETFAKHPLETQDELRDTTLALWRGARFREERYAAIELTGERRHAKLQTMPLVPMYEEMIVSGAWWDYVDALAIHRIGPILRRERRPMTILMREWARSDDLWKRRTAILCQNRFKAETDWKLLHQCIEPAMSSPEFFLRKAIGWALRELAWTQPSQVIAYVRKHRGALSALSKREALRNLLRSGQLDAIP